LLEVKGRPIINYILDKLKRIKQVDEIFIVTNNKFISRFREWKKEVDYSKRITLVNDLTKSNSDRLGAIGDVSFVINKKHLNEDLLVIGGDNLFSGPLNMFIDFASKNKPYPTVGFYRLKVLKDASRYGVAKLNKQNKITHFAEKPSKPKSRLVAMCLYYMPKESLRLVKDYMKIKKSADATGNYIDWLKGKIDTYGFIFDGSWYDIGDFKYLAAAKENFS
jgi:glucose-1-phosphate thymidylyltransferase